MKGSIRKGLSFGLTSGIITTLGLLVGLEAGTGSKGAVIAGIMTIAIADALSDALGMHIAEESNTKKERSIWEATASTFAAKLVFASSFLIPILLFEIGWAVVISLLWGILLLSLLSWWIARQQQENPVHVIGEHVFIAIIVVVLSRLVGLAVSHFI